MKSPVVPKHIRILLVEDNPADARLTEIALQEVPVETELFAVGTGAAALDFLFKRARYNNAKTPHIIILDLNLPKTDGREVLREIKSNPRLRKISVFILTTSSAPDDIDTCLDLRCNGFFTKPLDFEQFVTMLRSIEKRWRQNEHPTAFQIPPEIFSA